MRVRRAAAGGAEDQGSTVRRGVVRGGGVRRGVAAALVATASVGLTSCLSLPSSPSRDLSTDVPPGVGVAVPYVDIDAAGRSAVQLKGWAENLSKQTRISVTALQAYGFAAEALRQTRPECGLAWTTLAGIAGVESQHGTYRGASVAANGDVRPVVRGVPLDGTQGNEDIPDTDGGLLDGDRTKDRAMGPFQFIPETWQRYKQDANGDGKADPDNIDDAALTAARYLCVSGGDLTTAQGWRKAILTYNKSEKYLGDVRDRAAAYAAGQSY